MGKHYAVTTPLMPLAPDGITVQSVNHVVMAHYQKQMSKAVWRPAPGRKMGFLVTYGASLLGLIFLASPVIRMADRDAFLNITSGHDLRSYMDMSVCVGAQPIAWFWNIGKLLALIAPTLGDYVESRYPDDVFKGVTTTSLWGISSQYNRVYKHLGYTKGHGHEHISDDEYHRMLDWMEEHDVPIPGSRFGDGSNPRMRRIAAYRKASGDTTITLFHGQKRGIYYHAAVDPATRPDMIQHWYERWGLPRYERKRDETPPYQNGLADAS